MKYDRPAAEWNEALPIGNGRMGAMVFGHPASERLQLNEDSLWYGGPRDRNNPDAAKVLPEIRRLIFEGKPREAERLAVTGLSGIPETQRHYEPLGQLLLDFEGIDPDAVERVSSGAGSGAGRRVGRISASAACGIGGSIMRAIRIRRSSSARPPTGRGRSRSTARLERARWRYVDATGRSGTDAIYMTGASGGAEGVASRRR